MASPPSFMTTAALPDLKHHLAYPETPWLISPQLFQRLQALPTEANLSFKKCQVLPSDPEFDFVMESFYKQKSAKYDIKNIKCIHQGTHTEKFQGEFLDCEKQAHNPAFAPNWPPQGSKAQRTHVTQRFEHISAPLLRKRENSN